MEKTRKSPEVETIEPQDHREINDRNDLSQKDSVVIVVVAIIVISLMAVFLWLLNDKDRNDSNLTPTPTSTPAISVNPKNSPTDLPTPTPTIVENKQYSYDLNRVNLRGQSEPDLKINFETTSGSVVKYSSDDKNTLTIIEGNHTVTISAPTEGGYQAQYTEPPQIDTITNMLGLNVQRIKSEINGYPNYHYTNGYEVKADGGCEAHPGNDIKACDSGQIDFKQNDISHPITVGCNATTINDLEFCDSIILSLTYEIL